MEFTYNGFNGRIVHNPTDFILRLENVESRRIYEQTFFASNFEEVAVLGGLEFVERVMRSAFGGAGESGVSVSFVPSVHSVVIELMYAAHVLPRPVIMSLCVPAVKKASADADVSDMDRRIREIEPRLDAIPPQMAKMSDLIRAMMEKITSLEERCSDHIVLSGCPFAIPTHIHALELVLDKTSSGSSPGYASLERFGSKMVRCYGPSGPDYILDPDWRDPRTVHNQYGGIQHAHDWEPAPGLHPFSTLTDIKQLMYLTTCQSLTISGSATTNYSIIGQLTTLTSLTITGSRKLVTSSLSGIRADTAFPDHPPPNLTDISWIKSLKHLTHVCFRGCTNLVDITPLRELPNLKSLDIRETGVRNTDFLLQPGLTITRS